MSPIEINEDVFESNYNELQFKVPNSVSLCTNLTLKEINMLGAPLRGGALEDSGFDPQHQKKTT